MEVISPGGLYGRITPETFGTGDTDYRNPLLAEAMYNLGFAQRFGLGVPLAREALLARTIHALIRKLGELRIRVASRCGAAAARTGIGAQGRMGRCERDPLAVIDGV